ncbi:hypothetical protein HMPREF9135_0948 [Segatella baroniae F0067]|uniref:Uncharacterized protein n=1 Tax=Segatella baroniae F0067 TaxID=1115809 RepID=U2P3Z0_9BACT|nr:hypothetical protein HMPREF9135_0948 [Segatella baroniae F0067]
MQQGNVIINVRFCLLLFNHLQTYIKLLYLALAESRKKISLKEMGWAGCS